MQTSSDLWKGYIFVLISASADATLPIIGKIAYQNSISPGSLFFIRNAFSFLLLAGYLSMKHKEVICKSPLVLVQGILLAAQELLFYFSLQHLPASIATITFYTYPIIVAVAAAIIFRERTFAGFYIGLLMAFVGICISTGIFNGNVSASTTGLLLAGAASLIFAAFSLLGQKTLGDTDPVQLMATFSFISVLIVSALFCRDLTLILEFNIKQIAIGCSAGIINNVLGLMSFLAAIQYIGASKTSMGCTLEPIISVMLAVIILNEPFTVMELTGSLLVIGSIMLSMPGVNEKMKNILVSR